MQVWNAILSSVAGHNVNLQVIPRAAYIFFLLNQCLPVIAVTMGLAPSNGTEKNRPQSAFKSGQYKGTTPLKGRKDIRHHLIVEGFQNGIVLAYMEKHSSEEEPFLGPDYRILAEDPNVGEELGINAVVFRKGLDGISPMPQAPGSSYHWRQFLLIVGEDNNTADMRRTIAEVLVAHFNANATTEFYQYPRKVKFHEDRTPSLLEPVDKGLLDEDVIGIMMAAYPGETLVTLQTYPEIMASFWSDADHGREVMEGSAGMEDMCNED